MCKQIWRRGQQRADAFNVVDDQYKQKPIIVEGEFHEVIHGLDEEQQSELCGDVNAAEEQGTTDGGADASNAVSDGINSTDGEEDAMASKSTGADSAAIGGDGSSSDGEGSGDRCLHELNEEYHQITIDEWMEAQNGNISN